MQSERVQLRPRLEQRTVIRLKALTAEDDIDTAVAKLCDELEKLNSGPVIEASR